MYFRNFTTLFVKYSYLYFSSHGVYGSKVKKRNKHQYVNECHLISYHWSNIAGSFIYPLRSRIFLKFSSDVLFDYGLNSVF